MPKLVSIMPKLKFPKPLQLQDLHRISTDLENKNKQFYNSRNKCCVWLDLWWFF